MIYRLCSRCGKRVVAPNIYCDKCKKIIDKENRKRYKDYNNKRYSNKEERKYINFYSSMKWITIRDSIRLRDCGICLICWYRLCNGGSAVTREDNNTCASDYVHHIVELRDDYNKGLDSNNLISVCSYHHGLIHREYDKGNKLAMQEELRKILKWFIEMFYKKEKHVI